MIKGAFQKEQLKKILSKGDRFQIVNSNLRKAGVLIIIYPNLTNSYSLIITKRTEKLSKHKGEPSFPGGQYSPEDTDIIQTALRESNEEIDLYTENVEILGLLDDMCTISGYVVTPVVGYAKKLQNFILNHDEVDKIFIIPIEFFLDPKNFRETFMMIDNEKFPLYFFNYTDKDGKRYDIWGATAYIIIQFLKKVYSYNPSKTSFQRYTVERIEKMLNRSKKIKIKFPFNNNKFDPD